MCRSWYTSFQSISCTHREVKLTILARAGSVDGLKSESNHEGQSESNAVRIPCPCETRYSVTYRGIQGTRDVQRLKLTEFRICRFPEIRISVTPEFRILGDPEFWKSGFPEIRNSGNPDFRNPDFRNSRFLEFRISKNPEFRSYRNPNFRTSELPEFGRDAGHARYKLGTSDAGHRIPNATLE